jgi:hypothetical protein
MEKKSKVLKIGPPYYKYTLYMVEFFGGKVFYRRYFSALRDALAVIEKWNCGGIPPER